MKAYSNRKREVFIKELSGGLYFAFNFSYPSGVKLISKRAADRLKDINHNKQEVDANNEIDKSLTKCGLLGVPENRGNKKNSISVWLHIVNACNLSCHYCYIPNIKKVAGNDVIQRMSMKSEDVKKTVKGLIDYCKSEDINKLHVKFAGGEPTLNIDAVTQFCEEIERLKNELIVSYGMISNGVFESNSITPMLKEFGINLSVSIDGYEDSHDKIRFQLQEKIKKGTWKEIWSNIEILLANDLSPYLLYTVTPANYTEIRKFSIIAHEHNLGFRLSLERKKRIYPFELQQAISNELCSLYEDLGNSLDFNLPIERYARFSEWSLNKRKYIACSAGRQYFAIDEQGGVSTCQMNMDAKYGNIKSEGLGGAISNIKSMGERKLIVDPSLRQGVCTECEYYHVCAGGCPEHHTRQLKQAKY